MHRIQLGKMILHIYFLIVGTSFCAPACWGSSRLTTMISGLGTTFASARERGCFIASR